MFSPHGIQVGYVCVFFVAEGCVERHCVVVRNLLTEHELTIMTARCFGGAVKYDVLGLGSAWPRPGGSLAGLWVWAGRGLGWPGAVALEPLALWPGRLGLAHFNYGVWPGPPTSGPSAKSTFLGRSIV